jgi:polyisoprenyl-teichoic acid--peptidoglycan teichoic acid transferase
MSPTATASRPDAEDGVYLSRRGGGGLRSCDALGPSQRRRRAFTLVLLTLLVPGSAQLVAGNRRLGRFALRLWLALVACGALLGLLLLVSRTTAIGLLGRGWVLGLLQWGLTGYAAWWAMLFVDAWRLGGPANLVVKARRWLTAVTAGLLVVTSGGLVYAANTVGAGRAALDSVFTGSTATPPANGRYNILLLGADTGKGRVGTRPDSIQLASIDARTGRAVMFGFARDTENINFRPGSTMARLMPGGWNCGDQCLLNALYTWGQEHRTQFPPGSGDPGIVATREAVEALSGLDVQYYVMIDLKGFQKMVDAMGGLDVMVKYRTPIGGGSSPIRGWIEPGRQHLDGYHALWYSRSRQGSTNYERMARQRCVMTAMVDQLDPETVLTRFQKIAAASSGLIETDIPRSELGRFADLAMKTRAQKIRSVNFVPPLIKPWDYDPTVVRHTVAVTVAASEKASQASQRSSAARPVGAQPAAGSTPSSNGTARQTKGPGAAASSSVGPGSAVTDPAKAAGNTAERDLSSMCAAVS